MNETIRYYNEHAQDFIAGTLHADVSGLRDRFLQYVRPGGLILDAGCGSGRDALAFMKLGYGVHAFDASEELCRRASEMLGIPVECKRFEDLSGTEEYDGIWACASLLHVGSRDLPDVMLRLKDLLKPDGILYASFKEGNAEEERKGRFFRDMTMESCRDLFVRSGFEVLELFQTQDVREGRAGEAWVNAVGRKTKENI